MAVPANKPLHPDEADAGHGVWLHRYAVALALMTLLLIAAGGMVTSTGSGLSVPDWPTTYGHNMFTYPPSKWVGGIFYEHGHRLIASTVGLLTIGLAVWLWRRESRRWLRTLGWIALLTVVCQGILGGLTVLYLLPTPISVFHACLAQTFLCIVVSIAVFTSPTWKHRGPKTLFPPAARLPRLCLAMVAMVFVQLLLGALMRHTESGLAVPDFPSAYGQLLPDLHPGAVEAYNRERAFDFLLPPVTARQIVIHLAHRVGAVGVTILVLSAATSVLRSRGAAHARLRRPTILIVGLLAAQIGLGAWTVWSGKAPWIATAHVAVGAATLGACWWLTLRVCGSVRAAKRKSAVDSVILSGAAA